jgi:type IV secretory pathway TraG/TraD family ATPase VirD4
MTLMLACFFLLFILFFQNRNRALVFLVNVFVVVWLFLYGYVFQGFSHKSVHQKLYFTLLIGNSVGFVFYIIFLIKGRKTKDQKPEKSE